MIQSLCFPIGWAISILNSYWLAPIWSGHSEHGDLLLRLWLHHPHHLQTAAGGILVSHSGKSIIGSNSGQSFRSGILVSYTGQSFMLVIQLSHFAHHSDQCLSHRKVALVGHPGQSFRLVIQVSPPGQSLRLVI